MNYTRQRGDPTRVLPITKYISVKQTIKRLELALIALQGIPNRHEQARELYGSLSTQGKPPEKKHQILKQSKSFKTSGKESKDFYEQYFPISYDIPEEDDTRLQLKTWGHAKIDKNTLPPHIRTKSNPWTQIHVQKLQFNVADYKQTHGQQRPPKHMYKLKQSNTGLILHVDHNMGYAHVIWNDFEEENKNNWTTYCAYLTATNPHVNAKATATDLQSNDNTMLIKSIIRNEQETFNKITQLQDEISRIKDVLLKTPVTVPTPQPTPTPQLTPKTETHPITAEQVKYITTKLQLNAENIQKNKDDITEINITNQQQQTQIDRNTLTNHHQDSTNRKQDETISEIQDKIEPHTLWDDLAAATDITSNAFSIANNARQIAQDTRQTMLSKIADITQTVNSVTGTLKNVSGTLRDVSQTVQTLTNTVDSVTNTIDNVKKVFRQKIETTQEDVQQNKDTIQPIIDRLKKLEQNKNTEKENEPNMTLRFFSDTFEI